MIQEILDTYKIKDFSITEVTHCQNNIPEEYHNNIIPALCVLQQIRTTIMHPILIHSTYRNPEYNRKVGGKQGSLHLVFNAIDFSPFCSNYPALWKLYDQICQGRFTIEIPFNGKLTKVTPGVMGIGLYHTFIHIDTRGLLGRKAPARWYESDNLI